jgi:hypothetical protein
MYTNNKRENLNVYREARYKVIEHTNEKRNPFYTHRLKIWTLTLILLTWKIWWVLNNASKWKMGFNFAFKGLMYKEESLTVNKHKE